MATENDGAKISFASAIVWCCLLPNAVLLVLSAIVWKFRLFGDWVPAGLKQLTEAETLRQVRNVVGIGGAFLTLVLLCLILIPNLVITTLVSGRGFQSKMNAFGLGFLISLILPCITIMMLTFLQAG